MRLYTAGECVTPGEPPLFELSLLETGAAQISMYAMNLSQRAWPLAVLSWWMLGVFHPLPLLHHFCFVLFLSVEVCFWSVLFTVCGLVPKSFHLYSFAAYKARLLQSASDGPLALAPPALCLSHYRTCEPLQLLLAQQLGLLHCSFTFICTNLSLC